MQNHECLELFFETKTNKQQVIAPTETWLKDYMEFSIFTLAGYPSSETVNRNRRSGGVVFNVSLAISYNN